MKPDGSVQQEAHLHLPAAGDRSPDGQGEEGHSDRNAMSVEEVKAMKVRI
jgi:hypothetical protein